VEELNGTTAPSIQQPAARQSIGRAINHHRMEIDEQQESKADKAQAKIGPQISCKKIPKNKRYLMPFLT
jgi:hypothetical protein